MEKAITNGHVIIIENLGEDIDATLDPVLSRAIYKKARNFYIRFGGEEVEYDDKFQLYLQTKLSNPVNALSLIYLYIRSLILCTLTTALQA